MTITYQLSEIEAVALVILNQNPHKIMVFDAEMGVGKTTLIKQLVKQLGVHSPTSSPTFSLINEYQTTDNQVVYHFDFYRLKTQTEALDFGVEDYFYSDSWCFIEWPEKIPDLIPKVHTVIKIKALENGSRILELK